MLARQRRARISADSAEARSVLTAVNASTAGIETGRAAATMAGVQEGRRRVPVEHTVLRAFRGMASVWCRQHLQGVSTMRVGLTVTLAVVLVCQSGVASAASPPPNDFRESAHVVPDLPFRQVVDTGLATSSQEDELAACQASPAATVWYRVQVDAAGELVGSVQSSAFAPVIAVISQSEPEGSFEALSCKEGDATGKASFALKHGSGGTYFIVVGSADDRAGLGELTIDDRPPLEYSHGSVQSVSFTPVEGTAHASVALDCSREATLLAVGYLRQERVTGTVHAPLRQVVSCDGPSQAELHFLPSNGERFLPGPAAVRVTLLSCDDVYCFGLQGPETTAWILEPRL